MQCFRLFNISVLASLWKIISGEHLKMGDPKLEELLDTMEMYISMFGNPITFVSLEYIWLYKLVNSMGISQCQYVHETFFEFHKKVLKDHKGKIIDGENCKSIFCDKCKMIKNIFYIQGKIH